MLIKEAPLLELKFSDILSESGFYDVYPDMRDDLKRQLSQNDKHFLRTGKAIFDDAKPQDEEDARSRLNLMAAAMTYHLVQNLYVVE